MITHTHVTLLYGVGGYFVSNDFESATQNTRFSLLVHIDMRFISLC